LVKFLGIFFKKELENEIKKCKQVEASLVNKRNFIDLVINSLPGIFCVFDKDGRILRWNQKLEIVSGYSAKEISNMNPLDFISEEEEKLVKESIKEVFSKGESSVEAYLLSKDGNKTPYLFTAQHLIVDNQNYLIGIGHDISRRRKLEETLQESEKKYRDLVDNALVGIYKTNLRGDILYVNEALWRMMEFESPEEMMAGGVLIKYKDPKNREIVIDKLRKGHRVENFEVVLVAKTGKPKDVILSATLDGDTISGMIMDITERKRAKEALRESKELFEKVFFSQQDAIFILDSAIPSKIIDYNPGVTKVFGYNRQEIIGRTTEILHVDDTSLKEFRKYLYPSIDERGFLHLEEFQMRRKDGTVFHSEHSVTPLEDGKGKRIGWVSVVRDVTERKRAEEKLRESETRYRKLADSIADVFFELDKDLRYTYWNKASEKLTGIKAENAIGKSLFQIFPDRPDTRKAERVYLDVLRTQKPHSFVNKYRIGDNDYFFEISAYPSERGLSVLAKDVTERKQTENERERLFKQVYESQKKLQKLSRRLVEVQEADRRFLASELHDQIGQNLTALSINLNIIRSQFLEEVDKKIVGRLEDSMKLVEETIERMRNVMAGLRPPVLDDYGLVVALRWYTERFSERTGVTAILQERELSPRLPLVVETELFRIVQEVLTNVSKHANAKHVIITLERMDGVVQLAVSDDGVGFDHSVLRKLENQPRWGLITMEERAKAVGGKVYVKSEPGKGTQIIVQVPC
jgi:PAS domain S-box-containing protein